MTFPIDRRRFLHHTGGGFGGLALAHLLSSDTHASLLGGRLPYMPKAKRVIQLFMNGGVSQMDTFDPKPRLTELHGKLSIPGPDSSSNR